MRTSATTGSKILGRIETEHLKDGVKLRAATFKAKKGKGSYDRKKLKDAD